MQIRLRRAAGALAAAFVAAAALPASAASAPSAPPGGNDLDLVVVGGQVYQSIQTGTTTLVAGKSTFVRCRVVAQGTIPPGAEYDGRMRVFDGGVELPESPIYSTNGPIPVTPLPTLEIDGSLNFVFLPPDTSNLSFVFEINPAGPGQLAETTYANNTVAQGPFAFECKRRPEMIYVPIDYRPGGGSIPNPPDPNLVQPGMGDAFVQGIYPSADWDYRCYDQGTKLWTESVAGSGSALNNSLTAEWQLMNPKPDYLYGWVPGGLSYNGQSIIGGVASMGNTEPIRFQRTFAHELGHNTGLQHNNTTTFTLGVDVEHHLLEPQGLGQVKDPTLKDIMTAGLLTHEAWVAPSSYEHFVNHPTFVCAQPATAPAGELLMVLGVLDRSQRTVDLDAGVVFTGGVPTPTVPVAEADLVLRVVLASGAVAEYGLAVRSSADCPECAGGDGDTPHEDPLAGFVAVLPAEVEPAAVQRVAVVDAGSGEVVAALGRTPHAPELAILSPRPSLVLGGQVTVAWEATDADGDELAYYVRYSPDGERVLPLATNASATSLVVDLDALPGLVAGAAWLEVLATDGLNTSRAVVLGLGTGGIAAGVGGNAPDADVLTPNDGAVYPKGATVILHGMAWDLEDRSLDGADVLWTSSLDGAVATGRRAAIADLSVGTHVLTFTATDSALQQASEAVTITVTDRVLPGAVVCQADLGFGGPGTASLSLCGGDLATGTTAELELAGGPASQPLWVAIGAAANPTPLLGGTAVPVPTALLVPGVTDAAGVWTVSVNGGGGAATLFLQAFALDAAEPFGFAISNALQADFLP